MVAKSLATTFPRCVLAAAAVVTLAMSGIATAATNAPTYCESNPAFFDQQSDSELTVSKVDLGKNDVKNFNDSDEEQQAKTDAALAPLLYLAPRVESILDDVFENQQSDVNEAEKTVNGSIAPVADTSAPSADDVVPEEPQEVDVQPVLLRIQREMYRTDI